MLIKYLCIATICCFCGCSKQLHPAKSMTTSQKAEEEQAVQQHATVNTPESSILEKKDSVLSNPVLPSSFYGGRMTQVVEPSWNKATIS
jgi:hypothetical protein